jgi:protein TonB
MLNSKFDLYKSEWLDLVFADRNKSYGAYDLRNHYGDNMMKALAITVLGFTVAAISFTIAFRHDVVPSDPLVQVIPDIPITPPKIEHKKEEPIKAQIRQHSIKTDAPKPRTAAPQVNMNTQRVLPPRITTEPVTTEPPVIDMNKQISSTNNTADPTKPTTGILDGTNTPGSTPAKGTPAGEPDGHTYDLSGVDVMPEPFGGAAAWSRFIQKTLRYPETDMEGRVSISFIVEKDGHLSDIQVIKGVSAELDREAVRVIKLAPAWKPGKQNGQPVRVKYTIPIVFQMNQ